MGSSGGAPQLQGGFFPNAPQFNPGGLMPFDLGKWAQSGGTQVSPMGGPGIFGAQQQQPQPMLQPQPLARRRNFDTFSAGDPYWQLIDRRGQGGGRGYGGGHS